MTVQFNVTNVTLVMMAIILTGCQVITSQPSSTIDGARQVNQVAWTKSGAAFDSASQEPLPKHQSRVIIVRKQDNDPLETSTNIAIDGRFHTSLQPGHYSEAIVCAGQHEISAQLTGKKTNLLPAVTQQHALENQSTHFFAVDVSDTTQEPTLRSISLDDAELLLANSTRQTHQIDRVVTSCVNEQPAAAASSIPATVLTPALPQTPANTDDTVTVNMPIALDVLFDFDSSRIQPTYYPRLSNIAQFITANANTTVVIEGHTDSKGPASYNLKLSTARANAVKTYLMQQYSIDPQRLTTTGYGESQPVASNDTVQGRQSNRRVVATISQN